MLGSLYSGLSGVVTRAGDAIIRPGIFLIERSDGAFNMVAVAPCTGDAKMLLPRRFKGDTMEIPRNGAGDAIGRARRGVRRGVRDLKGLLGEMKQILNDGIGHNRVASRVWEGECFRTVGSPTYLS